MKHWAIISTLCLGFILTGCARAERVRQQNSSILAAGAKEVLPDVFDDQFSSVYIRLADADACVGGIEGFIAEIMTKKRSWKKQFPDRKIVATSMVVSHTNCGHAAIVGLLIDYETHE
jgi:hypothetical protein